MNLVCFRDKRGDATTQALLESLNASGSMFLSHTKVDGRYVIRFSVGQAGTQARHIDAAWEEIVARAAALESSE